MDVGRIIGRIDQVADSRGDADAGAYSLVVPVDRASESNLEGVEQAIRKMGLRNRRLTVLGESGHHLNPPHTAAGFISQGEFDQEEGRMKATFSGHEAHAVRVSHGRQRHSLGFTPWG